MANNPFDPKLSGLLAALGAERRSNSLLDYIQPPTPPKPEVSPMVRALADLLMEKHQPALPVSPYPYTSQLGSVFGSLAPAIPANPFLNPSANLSAPSPPPSQPMRAFGSLADIIAPPVPPLANALYAPPKLKPVAPETKRRVFFSFHFDDIMRVNNVRNAWKIAHPDSSLNRSFFDSSLWESRKRLGPEGIKQLIRAGVLRTSAVCVLAGSMTWNRRWVKYEIARAIIDGRGLLTVHINNVNHHQTKGPHPLGLNPLAHMGVAKLQSNKLVPPRYFLYEMELVLDGDGAVIEQWRPYADYTLPVKKPAWLDDPPIDHVMPLAVNAAEYDYELDHGHCDIGSWIDQAATQAGR
jgi:hypothetical protein